MTTITLKQINFIKKLDANIQENDIKNYSTIEASKLIRKLLNQNKNKEEQPKKQAKPKEEIKRTHNVKVGDVFVASWGYEQTNLDFFLVAELVGASSCRLLPVHLAVKEEETMPHGMARDVKFDVKDYAIDTRSVFIKDTEKGDLKRIQTSKWNGEEYIKISNFCNAYKYNGQQLYESWYY